MTEIKKFTLKDVRCFEGRQEFNIRPLTFLVGENGTGKSTVLGCMQALGGFVTMRTPFILNTEPYDMGVFADVARNIRASKALSFELGFEIQMGSVTLHLRVTLIERMSGSEPSVARIEIEFDEGLIVCELDARGESPRSFPDIKSIKIKGESSANTKPVYALEASDYDPLQMLTLVFSDPHYFLHELLPHGKNQTIKKIKMFAEKITSRAGRAYFDQPTIYALFPPYSNIRFASFAPVRAKPSRTYNPEMDKRDPEGSSVPMTLINLYRKDADRWKSVRKSLVKFGKSSGLFTNINMKPLGKSANDPFQIQLQIESGGPKVNIADVGYGISQILPLLVRVFTPRNETVFLVQQPEVHLHPKGQAALCSLFADIAKQQYRYFVVETHSDYMVNRARIEIMKGNISPNDVSLIYLDAVNGKVKVHNITFDENANFDPPKSYGEFFLRESNRMLGFED